MHLSCHRAKAVHACLLEVALHLGRYRTAGVCTRLGVTLHLRCHRAASNCTRLLVSLLLSCHRLWQGRH